MKVAVKQYMRPNGETREIAGEIPDHLALHLRQIHKRGLTITAEELTTGQVSFALSCDKYATDFDIEICANGPGHNGTKAALTRLIQRFDLERYQEWLKETKAADDGCGVGWGT